LKEEALDRTQWRTRFGRGYGPVVRQTAEWIDGCQNFFKLRMIGKCRFQLYSKYIGTEKDKAWCGVLSKDPDIKPARFFFTERTCSVLELFDRFLPFCLVVFWLTYS
jgi:hypothetical protein